jgi:hypothetical protein
MDMKSYIKQLLREGLNCGHINNHKLCYICRLKAISINENEFKGVLTEEERQHKLSNILLMLEKEIKVGDNLTKKLNSINSDLSKKLLAFLNSDKVKDTAEVEYVDYDKNNEKLFTLGYTDRNGNQKTRLLKINKLLNYLGSSIEDIKDYEIEELISHLKKADTSQLKIVTGDDILKAYHCANYDEGETMGSCMRFDAAQEYLEIYTDNPNEVKCLVLINPENDKVRGRALIWHMDNDQYFMDRIYTTNKEFNTFFNNYAEENGISKRPNSTVTLENGGVYDKYPYMDTFEYYDPETATLATSGEQGWIRLQDTGGGHSDAGVYIEYGDREGDTVDEDEAYYLSYRTPNGYVEGYAHQDDVIGIDGEVYLIDDCIKTYDHEWVYKYDYESNTIELTHGRYEGEYAKLDDAIELENGEYGDNQYVTREDYYVELDNDIYEIPYALSDDAIEAYDEKTILKSDAVELYREHYGEAKFAHQQDVTKVNTKDYGDVWILDTDLDEFEEKEQKLEEIEKNIDLETLKQNLKNGLITQREYDDFVRRKLKHSVTENKKMIKKLLRGK